MLISCLNRPKHQKFESILNLEDTLHPVFIKKIDSLIFYESLHDFFKDSCIVYGTAPDLYRQSHELCCSRFRTSVPIKTRSKNRL